MEQVHCILAIGGWGRGTLPALFSQWIGVIKMMGDLGREVRRNWATAAQKQNESWIAQLGSGALSLRNELHVLDIALCFHRHPDCMQWKTKMLCERNAKGLTRTKWSKDIYLSGCGCAGVSFSTYVCVCWNVIWFLEALMLLVIAEVFLQGTT